MYVVLFVLIANAPAYCLHTKLLLWGVLSASIAQRLEHWSCKPGVESSNLSGGFLFFIAVVSKISFFAGKILNDSQPLSDYNIQESNFVVVMVSKVKAAPAPTKPPEVR